MMKHYAALISFLALCAACSSNSSPLPGSPSLPAVQSAPAALCRGSAPPAAKPADSLLQAIVFPQGRSDISYQRRS